MTNLDLEAKTSWDLWKFQYEQHRDAFERRRQNYVFSQMNGPQSSLAQFMIRFHKVDTEADMEAYISRNPGRIKSCDRPSESGQSQCRCGNAPRPVSPTKVPAGRHRICSPVRRSRQVMTRRCGLMPKPKYPNWNPAALIDTNRADQLRQDTSAALREHFYPAYSERSAGWTAISTTHLWRPRACFANPDGES